MIQSKSLGSKIFNVFNIILMSLLSLSCLYPLWYTLCLSVSDKTAANSGKVSSIRLDFPWLRISRSWEIRSSSARS